MKKIILSLMLAIVALALAAPAFAAAGPVLDGKIVVGEDYTLKSGQTIQGDLVVLSGSATVEAGARVEGNVVVMGGSADIAGQVSQNVTVLGGSVTVRGTAEVDGELAVMGGSITREEGAQVKGGESQGLGWSGNWDLPGPRFNPLRGLDPVAWVLRSMFEAGVMIVTLSLLALFIAVLWPEQTSRVGAAIATAPAVSGLLGMLTLVAVPIVLAMVAVTICLVPVSLLGMVAYVAAILFGWAAFGLLLGNRLAAAFRWNLPPAGAAVVGTGIFTFIAAPLWIIPGVNCLGVPLDLIFACLGLGGVVLTRFGTTPYLSGMAFMAPPAPPAAPVPPVPPTPPAMSDLPLFSHEEAPTPEAPEAPAAPPPPEAGEPPAS